MWIVNVPQRLVEVHRDPRGQEYSTRIFVRPGEPLAPSAFPDAGIDTKALFEGEE